MNHSTILSRTISATGIFILLLLNIGCGNLPRRDVHLTIAISERLGEKKTDKLPSHIIDLCLPIEDCSEVLIVPAPTLYRVGFDASKALETTVSGGIAGNRDNPRFITRAVKSNLSSIDLGSQFSEPNNPSVNLASALKNYLNSTSKHSAVLIYARGGSLEGTDPDIPFFTSIDSLRKYIARNSCENNVQSFTVLIDPPTFTTDSQPPPLDPVDHQARIFADKDFQEYLAWRNSEQRSIKQIIERLQQLEVKHSWDYRFTIERTRESIYGYKDHHEAFELLKIAAEKSIRNKQSQELLSKLLRERDDKERGFWKLSTHPKDWDRVIDALQDRDSKKLYMSQKDEHKH